MQTRSIYKKWCAGAAVGLGAAVALLSAGPVIADGKRLPTKGGGASADGDEFSELTQGRPVVNGCNGSFRVEVDAVSFQLGFMDFATDLPTFTWEQAKHDIIESCRAAVQRLAPLCRAQNRGHGGDPDDNPALLTIKKGIKKVRCSLYVPKKKGASQAPQSSFADGIWDVAFTWWNTSADFVGSELAVATGLNLLTPDRETAQDDHPARSVCRSPKDCKSGFTCAASAAHGPRCLSKTDLAPPPVDDTGESDETPSSSGPTTTKKPKAPKKGEGEVCRYTSECEQRPGIRCTAPRGSKSGTKQTCTDVTHGY